MWCDFCGRSDANDRLPSHVSVRDIGGELICEACDEATITTVGIYTSTKRDDIIAVYYREEPVDDVISVSGTTVELQDELSFSETQTAKEAYETVQSVKGPANVVVDANHDE